MVLFQMRIEMGRRDDPEQLTSRSRCFAHTFRPARNVVTLADQVPMKRSVEAVGTLPGKTISGSGSNSTVAPGGVFS
jgi:hypothetical protein